MKSLTGFSGYSHTKPSADNAEIGHSKENWKYLLELGVEALRRAWTSDFCLELGCEFWKDHFTSQTMFQETILIFLIRYAEVQNSTL